MSADDEGATVRRWTDVVRRAELDATTKLIALLLATYADGNGRRIFPGVARLAVESSKGYRTVQRVLANLRTWGLVECVRRGSRARPAEYRLTLRGQVGGQVVIPTPTQHAARCKFVDEEHRRTRATQKAPVSARNRRHPDGTAKPKQAPSSRAETGATQMAPYLPETSATSTTNQKGRNLRTDVAVVGALPTGAPPQADPPALRVVHGKGRPSPGVTNQPALWPALVTTPEAATMARQRKPLIPNALRDDAPATPDAPEAPTEGHGFCLACYKAGQIVVASDPVNGSTCDMHEREAKAS